MSVENIENRVEKIWCALIQLVVIPAVAGLDTELMSPSVSTSMSATTKLFAQRMVTVRTLKVRVRHLSASPKDVGLTLTSCKSLCRTPYNRKLHLLM